MEPESQPTNPALQTKAAERVGLAQAHTGLPEADLMERIFLGSDGLRTGWLVIVFAVLWRYLPMFVASFLFFGNLIEPEPTYTAMDSLFRELALVLGQVGAVAVAMLLEQRSRNPLNFNLMGPRRGVRFAAGLGAGFVAIAALIIMLKAGGWLTLAPSGQNAGQILKYALLWGLTFLMVGFFEEGTFRCYLLATFTRGINLWWALAIQASTCGYLLWQPKGNGAWGVYIIALAGLAPCVWLYSKRAESTGFWLAAWVTSTLFGFVHLNNNGENPVGIFAAAAIGFVFVVSVRLTGSAWWAIGFHAAWDWTETFFFGTADSGMPAVGSYLVSKPAGNVFWSGGTDGPEGSVLVLAVVLLVLVAIIAVYGRRKTEVAQLAA